MTLRFGGYLGWSGRSSFLRARAGAHISQRLVIICLSQPTCRAYGTHVPISRLPRPEGRGFHLSRPGPLMYRRWERVARAAGTAGPSARSPPRPALGMTPRKIGPTPAKNEERRPNSGPFPQPEVCDARHRPVAPPITAALAIRPLSSTYMVFVLTQRETAQIRILGELIK